MHKWKVRPLGDESASALVARPCKKSVDETKVYRWLGHVKTCHTRETGLQELRQQTERGKERKLPAEISRIISGDAAGPKRAGRKRRLAGVGRSETVDDLRISGETTLNICDDWVVAVGWCTCRARRRSSGERSSTSPSDGPDVKEGARDVV